MYFVYVLRSLLSGRHYIGYTENLSRRLTEHNHGKSLFDKINKPFDLVYKEELLDKKLAMRREREIKSYKGGNSFRLLVGRTPR